jgi:hypothetical protein
MPSNPALVTDPPPEIPPSYRLSLGLLLLSLPIGFANLWVGGAIGLFSLFLTVQTALLKLRFSPTSLELYRGETLLRSFPYSEWETWEIFGSPLPILLYFKEVNSIHFVPILFDAAALRSNLDYHCPRKTATD